MVGRITQINTQILREFGYNVFANNRNRMWKTHWHKPNKYEQSFFID